MIDWTKLDELRAKLIKAHEQEEREAREDRCVVCKVNVVCPEDGEDTCHWCLKHARKSLASSL